MKIMWLTLYLFKFKLSARMRLYTLGFMPMHNFLTADALMIEFKLSFQNFTCNLAQNGHLNLSSNLTNLASCFQLVKLNIVVPC